MNLRILCGLLLASLVSGGIYPEGHFDRVQKLTELDALNDVTRLFGNNNAVAFGDVNLKESPGLRDPALGPPGTGGWPTIRYFNQETGINGAAYEKVTDLPMCSELGEINRMIDYVEGYANTVLCGLDGTNCNEKELEFLVKWKSKPAEEVGAQVKRLEEMTSKPMNDNLKDWAYRRIRILKRLSTDSDESSTEL
eukprot:Nitzschia sp. Nitz4//scaffold178_size73299//55943//56736//NITZ4_005715-RA/size73299-processed-gene-0.34-mRNA-1//-1//CDS//3329539170//3398//frame0